MKRITLAAFLILLSSLSPRPAGADCSQLFESKWIHEIENHRAAIVAAHHLPDGYTRGYFARRVEPRLMKPYPAVANPEKLYRGMFRTPEQLIQILREGMQLSKVKWTAAGGGISFSSNVTEASDYIFHAADPRPDGIGVVFVVQNSDRMVIADDAVLNPTRTIYKLHEDLPASAILDVLIWGEYGLESLDRVLERARSGALTSHRAWTGVFDTGFSR